MTKDKRISEWVDAHREEYIGDLARLVAIRSVRGEAAPDMPFGEKCAEALHEAINICEGYGFTTENYGNAVGTADLCGGPNVLDILGHLDVVGEGEGWSSDPYTLTVRDGCLYGRGTDDDKGPLLAALYAMRCVKELGLPLTKSARLIMGTDEESGFGDLKYYYEKHAPAPNTFSPDAEFPVFNTEKGSYKPEFSRKWAKETALPRVTAIDGGFRINVLPADASAKLAGVSAKEAAAALEGEAEKLKVALVAKDIDGGCEISVKGRGAHAAYPETGNNGITALIALLAGLKLADCDSTRAIRALREAFPHGDGRGEALGVAMEDELSGELTLTFSLLSMDEGGLRGFFDSRVPICATYENCAAVVEKRLSELGFAVKGKMSPAHHTPADSPFIKTLLGCYERYTGLKGECLAMGGGTYVHDIEGGVAFGAGMPDFESNLHGADEHQSIENMLNACKIFALVIAEMCE